MSPSYHRVMETMKSCKILSTILQLSRDSLTIVVSISITKTRFHAPLFEFYFDYLLLFWYLFSVYVVVIIFFFNPVSVF